MDLLALARWLNALTNENAPAIQAIFAAAAVVVAFVAAWIAIRQGHESAELERSRQRDAQILDIVPLVINEPNYRVMEVGPYAGHECVYLDWDTPADRYVLAPSLAIRRDGTEVIEDRPSLRPLQTLGCLLPLDRLKPLDDEPYEFLLSYRGRLGQKVIEHYSWRLLRRAKGEGDPRGWYLARLEIVTTVPGAKPYDYTFGAANPSTPGRPPSSCHDVAKARNRGRDSLAASCGSTGHDDAPQVAEAVRGVCGARGLRPEAYPRLDDGALYLRFEVRQDHRGVILGGAGLFDSLSIGRIVLSSVPRLARGGFGPLAGVPALHGNVPQATISLSARRATRSFRSDALSVAGSRRRRQRRRNASAVIGRAR